MASRYKFNRLEFSGSLGDLGTLLPLALGMILINGLNPLGLFLSIGLYYILSGCYFGITVPVQPMKVIGAYAIATAMTASQIMASGALMCVALFIIGLTDMVTLLGRYTPKPVVRGVQLSTGMLLVAEGVKLMIGTSKFQLISQAAEPYLSIQTIGPVPIGILIGVLGGVLTLFLLENSRSLGCTRRYFDWCRFRHPRQPRQVAIRHKHPTCFTFRNPFRRRFHFCIICLGIASNTDDFG